jgi:hypothetical protein
MAEYAAAQSNDAIGSSLFKSASGPELQHELSEFPVGEIKTSRRRDEQREDHFTVAERIVMRLVRFRSPSVCEQIVYGL